MPQPTTVLPLPQDDNPNDSPTSTEAVNLIRQKITRFYSAEPSAAEEEKEIKSLGAESEHQKFIKQLMDSGKSLVEIQTAWHLYYQSLPDDQKHVVWQEFYANQSRSTQKSTTMPKEPKTAATLNHIQHLPITQQTIGTIDTSLGDAKHHTGGTKLKTIADIKQNIISKASSGGQKLERKHHLQSLLFGLGMGAIVIFIFMFGFFNERFIAPLVTPSRNISDTPIIVDPSASNAVGPENKIIIPKINVEVPVVYDVPSIGEKNMQTALERGVVHYPQSPVPGQNGNIVVVGHSSNNIFNSGKYKFAFVLLNRLQEGDTFMIHHNGQRYIYKIYSKKIVKPSDVSVLGPADKMATATLITCDPPGTALNRLIILAEQISPSSNNNIAANQSSTTTTAQPAELPGNAETLFHRIFGWIYD